MPLSRKVGLDASDIVLDGDPAPPPQKGDRAFSQFSVHFYCGQTAGLISMPLGMEVGLGPGHIVLGEDRVPLPQKGAQTAVWIKLPLGTMAGLGPGNTVTL